MKKKSVVVVMGSKSDLSVMRGASTLLSDYGVGVQTEILSAHRTPYLLEKSSKKWESQGIKIIIAGAGGAAHLPGMLASFSLLPVIGVPIAGKSMSGLDSLLSIAQMPTGVPVATVAVDNAQNAALLAVKILATTDSGLRKKVARHKSRQAAQVKGDRSRLKKMGIDRFLKRK